MSYADAMAHPGIKPGGIIGSVGLSGGIFAALILLASGYAATPPEEKSPLGTIELTPIAPPIKIEPKETPKIPPIETPIAVLPTPQPVPLLPPLVKDPPLDLPPPGPLVKEKPKPETEVAPLVVPPIPKLDPPMIEAPKPVRILARIDSRYAAALQPEFPASMRRAGIEGRVVVRVKIGVDGRVVEFLPVSAPDPAFFDATRVQATKKWRFLPETVDGNPVESWKTMTLNFRFIDK